MFRYLILVGDARSISDAHFIDGMRQRHQASALWECAIDRPGFYAAFVRQASTPYSPIVLHDGRGVLFGQVFYAPTGLDEATPKPVRLLSREESDDIVQSNGKTLISKFWGYYVAALRSRENSTLVLRSPASPLACFHSRLGTLELFFSYLEDRAALSAAMTINWDCIASQVVGGDYLSHETAINEIYDLAGGEAIECGPQGSDKRVYWDPRCIAQHRSPMHFSDATRVIRNTVDYCVGALSQEHDRILVNLSGGLDSSIVLNSLARAPHRPSLTAVNYYSRGCGDERPHARCMARSVGCALTELARNDGLDLHRFDECNFSVRPVLNFSAPDVEARNIELARDLGATAIFNGELGDNIFGRSPSPAVLLEYLRLNGPRPGLATVARDFGILTRQSLWRTLLLMNRERMAQAQTSGSDVLRILRDRYGANGAESLFLASAETVERCRHISNRFRHPWLTRTRGHAPDTAKLLFGLVTVTSSAYHSPFSSPDDPPFVSPFISQPIVEAAIRIPGYLTCRGAQDRAVARAAFADTLPVEILNRGLGKGGPTLWAKDVVDNNSTFVREFLLDGVLVRRGLLDRKKVESALSPRMAVSTAMIGDIFAKMYIEAWVRNFPRLEMLSNRPRAAR